MMLNAFSKWCNWSGLQIRTDKCKTFGIKHNGRRSTQYKPYLKDNNEMIPPVEIDGSFRYLGKMFSYTMGTDEIRNELEEELTSYLDKVDKLPQNAFGEVHHNLLQTILSYHHIPIEISGLIRNMYEDYIQYR